jgi:hypothetical protein
MREPIVGDRVLVHFEWHCALHHMPWHRGAEGEVTAILTRPDGLPSGAGRDHPYYVHVDGDDDDFTKRYALHELTVTSPV